MKRFTQRLLISLCFCATAATAAEDESVDFSNKTIEFIVPYMPGGGTDTWARSVLPYLGRYLPGQPKILISNVPGGNAAKAANRYAVQAKPDGLSVLVTAASNHLSYLLGDSRVRYDFSQWRALLAYRAGVVVYTSPKLGVSNIQELLDKPDKRLILASMGPTSDDIFVLLAFDLLDIDVSAIFGSRGRGSARKLYENGDANIDFQTTAAYMAYVKPQESTGRAIPLFSLGAFDEEMNYVRDPMFPELPNLAEVYTYVHGQAPSGEAWQAWFSLYKAGRGSLKLLVVPKETSSAVIAAYENAVRLLKKDPEFNDSVVNLVGQHGIVGVKEAEFLLKMRTALPEETRRWISAWIYDHYQVRL